MPTIQPHPLLTDWPSQITLEQCMMEARGLKCLFHLPPAIKSRKDGIVHGLPPAAPVPAYAVEEYKAAPANLMRGNDRVSSYLVPVQADYGLWLDFNLNRHHTHDVAALVTIQGVNPLTGRKTERTGLEQYRSNCPVHDLPFGQARWCEECQFKWPAQNYLATTGTPAPYFWLDGFRSEDGKVRQYIFTEEEAKGVAAQIIGAQRVFAIAVAFYLSRQPKPPPPPDRLQSHYLSFDSSMMKGSMMKGGLIGAKAGPSTPVGASISCDSFQQQERSVQTYSAIVPGIETIMLDRSRREAKRSIIELASEREEREPVKQLEVGAGAQIKQEIYDDPQAIDYWEPEPHSIIYISYLPVAALRDLLRSGKREEKAGFLDGLQVGH